MQLIINSERNELFIKNGQSLVNMGYIKSLSITKNINRETMVEISGDFGKLITSKMKVILLDREPNAQTDYESFL